MVGDEYFMTRGHFHAKRECAEYYLTLEGEGALILMDESGRTQSEEMKRWSLHYIPGRIAHRVANTGSGNLIFSACWPSDAGHDYESIASTGFSSRMRKVAGIRALIAEP
jgi:glucose-6-phosphate isomerase